MFPILHSFSQGLAEDPNCMRDVSNEPPLNLPTVIEWTVPLGSCQMRRKRMVKSFSCAFFCKELSSVGSGRHAAKSHNRRLFSFPLPHKNRQRLRSELFLYGRHAKSYAKSLREVGGFIFIIFFICTFQYDPNRSHSRQRQAACRLRLYDTEKWHRGTTG